MLTFLLVLTSYLAAPCIVKKGDVDLMCTIIRPVCTVLAVLIISCKLDFNTILTKD